MWWLWCLVLEQHQPEQHQHEHRTLACVPSQCSGLNQLSPTCAATCLPKNRLRYLKLQTFYYTRDLGHPLDSWLHEWSNRVEIGSSVGQQFWWLSKWMAGSRERRRQVDAFCALFFFHAGEKYTFFKSSAVAIIKVFYTLFIYTVG
jgi:hypothetical protein